jgi:hypothetical protein
MSTLEQRAYLRGCKDGMKDWHTTILMVLDEAQAKANDPSALFFGVAASGMASHIRKQIVKRYNES